MKNNIKIGKNIMRARNNQALTQKMLSNKLTELNVPLCRGTISRIENDARIIKDIHLKALAKALNVEADYFYDKE